MTDRVNTTIENALWDYATKLAGSNPSVKEARRYLLAALDAEGLAVVPVEPTEEMVTAGDRAITWADNTEPSIAHGRRHLANVYRAMLAAAIREGKD